jgi:hypothetical protein
MCSQLPAVIGSAFIVLLAAAPRQDIDTGGPVPPVGRRIARIYEETLRSGRRDPLRAIMRELKIEKTAAASKVREARRRGFLTMEYFGKKER